MSKFFLEECKYIIKEEKVSRFFNGNIKFSCDDSDKSDKECFNDCDKK